MKKLALTFAIVLGLSMTTFADGGGLFQRGASETETSGIYNRPGDESPTPMLPEHNQNTHQDADAPLGTGIAVLSALGAAYLIGKRRNED